MKFGLFYLFSDFGNIPQDQLFHEVLEEIEYADIPCGWRLGCRGWGWTASSGRAMVGPPGAT